MEAKRSERKGKRVDETSTFTNLPCVEEGKQ